jgi:hypothetical protein
VTQEQKLTGQMVEVEAWIDVESSLEDIFPDVTSITARVDRLLELALRWVLKNVLHVLREAAQLSALVDGLHECLIEAKDVGIVVHVSHGRNWTSRSAAGLYVFEVRYVTFGLNRVKPDTWVIDLDTSYVVVVCVVEVDEVTRNVRNVFSCVRLASEVHF